MQETELTVEHESGLHLRPAAAFVQKAASFEATIEVRNVTKDTSYQNAKSAMGIMMLKVAQGDTIHIRAAGSDEQAALDALRALIESNFS